MHPFEQSKNKINRFISLDRMADAISELKVWATGQQDLYAELDNLSARLAANEKMLRKEEIDYLKYDLLQNRVRDAFQSILQEIDQLLDIKKMSESSIRAAELINLGREKVKEKKFQDALQFFQEAIQLKPDDMEALFYRGAAYVGVQAWLNAFEDFSLIIHLSREKNVPVFALINRGVVAMQLGQTGYACSDWKRVKFELGRPALVNDLLELNCTAHD